LSNGSSSIKARIKLQEPVRADFARAVPIIVAAFANGDAFLAAMSSRGPAGELVVRTRYAPAAGTPVVLEVTWSGLPNRVLVRATAVRRWFAGSLILQFGPEEASKRDYLMAMARGTPSGDHRRRHRRFCVRLPLTWRRFGDAAQMSGVAIDVSAGGMLVAAGDCIVAPNDRVAVRLRAEDGFLDLVLTGAVLHVRRGAIGEVAFGVRFEYRSSAEQRGLRAVLRAMSSQGVVLVDSSDSGRKKTGS
jgi:PilZ domain